MTNRQSNIIFYSIISIIIYALIINYVYPDFFENFTKSKKELSIKKAMNRGEHKRALTLYQELVEDKISEGRENNFETATIYEDMAQLYSLLGNKEQEKNYYLKSINIKKKLTQIGMPSYAYVYDKLGSLAEEEKQYDQAQMYYEKSLSKRLSNTKQGDDEGFFVGMQNTRQRYLQLNNEATISTLKKLGEIHNLKNEYTLARKYYEKALVASKITFGENDIKTLNIINLINQLAK